MKSDVGLSRMKKRAFRRTLLFGAMTAGLYAVFFAYSGLLVTLFAQGGLYALLPVGTVFLFSYFHGSFASNLWTSVGIVASVKTERKVAEKVRRVEKREPRPQLRAPLSP
ncbi:MAG: hypothetical protein AB1641_17325 [Thermodesulfobacteriota bacterium]